MNEGASLLVLLLADDAWQVAPILTEDVHFNVLWPVIASIDLVLPTSSVTGCLDP